MDRSAMVLTALVPRGWLVLALVALIPSLVSDAPPATIAISIGGILLAYRALQRLTAGLSNLTGAIIAGQSIASLARAASRRESGPLASAMTTANPANEVSRDAMVAQARDLTFRYRPQGEPVLQQCSLNIARNTRLLLEGPREAGRRPLRQFWRGCNRRSRGCC